jgi:hypothetical protein
MVRIVRRTNQLLLGFRAQARLEYPGGGRLTQQVSRRHQVDSLGYGASQAAIGQHLPGHQPAAIEVAIRVRPGDHAQQALDRLVSVID